MARYSKDGSRKVVATTVDAKLWEHMKKYLESPKSRYKSICRFLDAAIEWSLENIGYDFEGDE